MCKNSDRHFGRTRQAKTTVVGNASNDAQTLITAA
jgi:hypothetical protein